MMGDLFTGEDRVSWAQWQSHSYRTPIEWMNSDLHLTAIGGQTSLVVELTRLTAE